MTSEFMSSSPSLGSKVVIVPACTEPAPNQRRKKEQIGHFNLVRCCVPYRRHTQSLTVPSSLSPGPTNAVFLSSFCAKSSLVVPGLSHSNRKQCQLSERFCGRGRRGSCMTVSLEEQSALPVEHFLSPFLPPGSFLWPSSHSSLSASLLCPAPLFCSPTCFLPLKRDYKLLPLSCFFLKPLSVHFDTRKKGA